MFDVIDGLKLNRIKQVHTIKPRDLYARLGKREQNLNFESSDDPVVNNFSDKLSALEFIDKYDKMMYDEEVRRSQDSSKNQDESKSSPDDVEE